MGLCSPNFIDDHLCGSATQFRWIQQGGAGEHHGWGVDRVYIGEACPGLCSGRGYCTSGAICICDEGYQGGHWGRHVIHTKSSSLMLSDGFLFAMACD